MPLKNSFPTHAVFDEDDTENGCVTPMFAVLTWQYADDDNPEICALTNTVEDARFYLQQASRSTGLIVKVNIEFLEAVE